MAQKTLTISIAAYNAEACLEDALKSCVILEKKEDIEVIIVNDGSKDSTSLIAHEYAERYPDIFRVIDKENGGYGSTVNVAIQQATGKYFKLLDADDSYDTKELETLISKLKCIDFDMVVTDYMECKSNGTKRIAFPFDKEQEMLLEMIDCNIGMHAVCYKTSILKDNCIQLKEKTLYTDTEFVTYPLFYITSMYYIPIVVYQYNIGNQGQSVSRSSRINHANEALEIYCAVFSYYKNRVCHNGAEKLIQRKIASVAQFYLYALLTMKCSKSVKKEIIKFDAKVQNNSQIIYNMMNNRCIRLLRKSNYRMYRLCSNYVKYLIN